MHWFLVAFTAAIGARFAYQLVTDRGKGEATLPVRIFGETYRRDENFTMYHTTIAANIAAVVIAVALIGYLIFGT
jgi:hypothetical protein